MKIVFVASEIVPFAKTGGLADVAGTLPSEIAKLGHEVIAVLPRYQAVDAKKHKLKLEIEDLKVPIGTDKIPAKVYSAVMAGGPKVYFIDNPDFFNREGLYGTHQGDYPDNDKRFVFFQRGVLEMLKKMKYKADVIHCHDWHTGLIPAYLKLLYKKDVIFKKTKTVFTIHNIAYQGNFPPDSLPMTGLGWDQFTMERLEFYGKFSFLKAGILDADIVTTVSEQYVEEIKTEEFGCGLEGVLDSRSDKLFGIVNGIDPNEWDPSNDKDLAHNFSPENFEGKKANKLALQKENGFKIDENAPVVGFIARLVDQKGIDILLPALPEMMDLGFQFILLGTGDEKYHHLLRQLAKKYHEQCGIHIVFDSEMAKRIYAASDIFLFPSYYEPCGLGQMIALRFGTIPVVRRVGGLADTVEEYHIETQKGNGFLFRDYTTEALLESLKKVLKIYKDSKQWHKLMQNAFACDYSWTASAKKYVEIYEMTQSRTLKDAE